MNVLRGLLVVVILSVAAFPARAADFDGGVLPPCEDCGTDEWRIPLLPGDTRLALASPDGSRLVVLGGPGESGREHTVVVLERECGTKAPRGLVVSRSARFDVPPEELPVPFVNLAWSPDGSMLYAGGVIYRIDRDDAGLLVARKLREVKSPLLDFRFGAGDRAVAIKFVEGNVRQVRASGEKRYTVELEYALLVTGRTIDMPIPLRESLLSQWIVEEEHPPSVAWDDDASVLLGFAYLDRNERFTPGGPREFVDRAPAPRELPGAGPFSFTEPCKTRWELRKDNRVRLQVD